MSLQNAQDKAQRTRRDQEASQPRTNPRSCQGIGLSSQAVRAQPVGFGGTNRTRRDFSDRTGGNPVGGIVAQLIEETSEELAHHLEQAERLNERLQGLKALGQQLTEKIKEQ